MELLPQLRRGDEGGTDMSKIASIIGGIVVSVLLYAVPILTTCAFTLGWDDFIARLLLVVALVEFTCLTLLICDKAEGGE